MQKKVWDYVNEHRIFEAGDRVVAGVSGGADSVCMFVLLAESVLKLKLRVVHVHHGLRGDEADRDAEFVRKLCEEYKAPFEIVYRDVAGYAKDQGISMEEAGRILRYEALEMSARRWQEESGKEEERPVWIGVAHHQDDNVETILHHLLRGSGLRGLSGMQPVQGNRVRPLLGVRRQEIVEYLKGRGIRWCEDSTNGTGEYTRNRIRGDVIPYVTRYVNERASENILRAGRLFGQADRYLRGQAKQVWEKHGRKDEGGVYLDVKGFLEQEPVIRSYLAGYMLELAAPGQRDITARHFGQIEKLAEGSVGGRCDLPGKMQARRTYKEICIGIFGNKEEGEEDKNLERKESGCGEEENIVPAEMLKRAVKGKNMEFQVFPREKGKEIPKKEYTKWFDYDKIKGTLSVRFRRAGDYLVLPGGGRKKLTRFLIDEKVPRELRDRIFVLAEGSRVLWVVGYRISEYYKIMEDTHTILQVDFYGGEAYGR